MQNSQGSVMNALYRIADGAAEAMEFTVTASTRHLGTPADLSLKPGILVAVVARGGEIIIPEGSTSIQEGDSVILISRDRRLQDLNDIYDEGEHTFSAPGACHESEIGIPAGGPRPAGRGILHAPAAGGRPCCTRRTPPPSC